MTDREYLSKKASYIEELALDKFNRVFQVSSVLFDDIQTGESSFATIFQVDDHDLYVLHEDRQPVTLSTVQNRIKLLGIETSGVLSPGGDKDYFSRQGQQTFMQTYPGRTEATNQEREFYSSQVIYNPAIILISRIQGQLSRYSVASATWKPTDKFTYRREDAQS